ncbi:caspase-like [Sitodiplosis mosellana]|uniref:caspase-like n=1 Tax=Sitodiplosis mosellana TaxID=263140 RepID=UPI0024439705|nr:caspase-like [Sitodiplosis mosellana]XP_055318473.1 caspase-like [Sitodiplosis mosellana]XP_055318474.1 caspase-like [Sitodiplosis mosellana]
MSSPIEGTPIDGNAESKNDTTDALPGGMTRNHSNAARVARMPTEWNAFEYNMRHKKRGMAIIFNHEHFDISSLNSRTGTNVDCENLRHTLETLQFDVVVHKDLSEADIHQEIRKIANSDHSEHDCLLISILSHGELGYIYAKDTHYRLENIWKYFTAPECPTLAGKPKLFFIQACQGDRSEGNNTLSRTETDSSDDKSKECKIPIHADFLIAYSTIPGFYSWRNTNKGSWFVQCLCLELKQSAKKHDILTLLTFVCQRVAKDIDFESNSNDNPIKKQIPCITTMLTRQLWFYEK